MKTFKYKARKSPTEVVEGTLTAASQDEAVDRINKMGLLPIDLDEVSASSKPKDTNSGTVKAKKFKIPSKEVTVFYRQLSRLIKSGVPILSGMDLLSRQTESSDFSSILSAVKADIQEGSSFSAALLGFRTVFSSFEIALIQAGETAGKLDTALSRIASYRETQEALTAKVRSSIAYPLFMAIAGLITVFFMFAVVVPKFAAFFSDLGQELPFPTRLLITLSQWAQVSAIWIVCISVGAFFAFRQALSNAETRLKWDQFVLNVPKIGKVILMSELTRFATTLQLLIQSGVSLVQAVRYTAPVMRNTALSQTVAEAHLVLEQGGRLSDAISQSDNFPGYVVHLVRLGEESGHLDSTLGDISDWYEQETRESIQVMTQLLEPIMILTIGLILGFIIIAVLLPVFSLNAMVV